MKKLKAAIVGCGRISVSYADAFHRLSDEVELVYAVDKDPALAKAFAEEFNCSWTTDFDEILDKDIDVVHLCLPHFLHPVMAIKAMKAGINVLTEKPIATSGCRQNDPYRRRNSCKAGRYLPDTLHKKCGKAPRNDPAG